MTKNVHVLQALSCSEEATEQNFTLLFLTENDLEGFTNCDKKINKVSFSVIVWCFIITIKLSNDYVKI